MNCDTWGLTIVFCTLTGCATALAGETSLPKATVAEVRQHLGSPALFINGRPASPIAMIPIGDFPTEACRDFSRAGVRIYSHIIWNWRSITPGSNEPLSEANRWWLGPGRYDFSKVDRRLKAVLAADPQAWILPRLKLNPPDWWLKEHPDELTHIEDGSPGPQHSMASRVWEETYERMLRDLVGHIESSDYGSRVIGYHLAGGKSSEWFWWGFDKGLIDYSPAARQRFREWLGERYGGSVNALREAWRQPDVTFETADPPPGRLREGTEYGLFRDVAVARPAIDYVRFLSDMTSHNIIRSCRIVKEATGGRKITGVFYGYMLHFAHCRHLVSNEGMCGLEQVLASPHVDFLCSPPQYERRRGGQPGLFQSGYFGSYRLHNKLFWQEADDRTHLAVEPVSYRSGDLDETLGLLDRQFGYALAQMNGLWWFTLAGDETFRDETIMGRVAAISKAGDAAVVNRGRRRYDVAVFADEEVYAWMQMGPGALMYPLVTEMRRMLAHTGVPHDFYLLSDISRGDLPDYRMYVFLNAFRLTDELRTAIMAKTRRNHALSVWFYAPGFIDPDGKFNDRGVSDLTGIGVRHIRQSAPVSLDIARHEHAITADLPAQINGTRDPIDPIFVADDPDALVLGTLTPVGRPGLALREFDQWRSLYFAAPTMSPGLFRNLARYAGCHVYADGNDVFDANSRYVMLHAVTPGPKRIHLPRPAHVINVVTSEVVGRAVTEIAVDLERVGETVLFELSESTPAPD